MMSMNQPLRLSRSARRRQLLDATWEMVRDEGTSAITLSRVAARAGVTKPIAYRHFVSRNGLLGALYLDFDDRQTQALRQALESGGSGTLESAARLVAAAFVDCAIAAGPEVGSIIDALAGSAELEEVRKSCRARYRLETARALAPYAKQGNSISQPMLTGLLGASEAIAEASAAGDIDRKTAIDTLAAIIVSSAGAAQFASA